MAHGGENWEVTGVEVDVETAVVDRIWARDAGLWGPGEDDPGDRLGWLDLPETMRAHLDRLEAFSASVSSEGFSSVALLGMGGSSLAPEVLARTMTPSATHPDLVVLDSTHPDEVEAYRSRLDLDGTLFIVSSKSGGTVETMSLYRLFAASSPPDRFVAVTDPGSSLAELGRSEGFREVFLNPPDVGGRFSALSLFGLVPAAVAGIDPRSLLNEAARAVGECRDASPSNAALVVGTALARLAQAGRDKLTFVISEGLVSFGDWVEQLIAESTGKQGKGIVPVVGEPFVEAGSYGDDRVFVHLRCPEDDDHDAFVERLRGLGHPVIRFDVPRGGGLGAGFFRWEFITAVAGAVLDINPFDQPDVESAKRAARAALGATDLAAWPEEDPSELFSDMRSGELAALLLFAPRSSATDRALEGARSRLAAGGIATSAGYGPRYLHSTGQLHKGGPEGVRALVVLDPPGSELEVPGAEYGFGRLVTAQAAGDATALEKAGKRVARTTLGAFARWAL